jgi:hypothetical protein
METLPGQAGRHGHTALHRPRRAAGQAAAGRRGTPRAAGGHERLGSLAPGSGRRRRRRRRRVDISLGRPYRGGGGAGQKRPACDPRQQAAAPPRAPEDECTGSALLIQTIIVIGAPRTRLPPWATRWGPERSGASVASVARARHTVVRVHSRGLLPLQGGFVAVRRAAERTRRHRRWHR